MTIRLTAAEEAKLLAKARAEGTTPEALVRDAIAPIIAAEAMGPKKSMLGTLAPYGPAPSAEDIDESRKEMFASFGRDDIV